MMKTCLAVLLALSTCLASAYAESGVGERKKVTFVCEHGAAKSVIAALYFNRRAGERGLMYAAESRGMSPDSELQPATVAGLVRDGISLKGVVPAKVTAADAEASVKIVTIGIENEPAFLKGEKLLEWDEIPAVSKGYDAARDDLLVRIDALLDALAAQEKSK